MHFKKEFYYTEPILGVILYPFSFYFFYLYFFCDEFETSFNGESELGSMKPSEN